ncbi:hypothetical protein QC762_118470 [Podospora pseudocomata]|uniref:Suppressor of anucleate metulae protein B n=1 Tax=Podospora pseudocomata TaxID=2093779 RepID=A0ABR0GX72_9PEZI|nr:hypothetical protein QC762_118470 [Podospora pseudocomata]
MPPTPPPGTAFSSGPHGRSLVATQDFTPGSLIATFSSPTLALPDGPSMRTTCNYCLRVGSNEGFSPVSLKACTGCRAAVYCGPTCQRAHWKSIHKAECKMFARVRETTGKDWHVARFLLPTPARALAQVLLTNDKGIRDPFDGSDPLESNLEGFKADEQVWGDFELQAMAAMTYSGVFMNEDGLRVAMRFLCQIQTNAFNRLDADTGMSGIFLDPALARVNHSCVPNAFIGFDQRTATLRAERPIKEGEEITISYIANDKPRSIRREGLRLYYFECDCPRCVDDLDVYQVAQTSPVISLNSFSLQPDLTKFREPAIDKSGISMNQIEIIYKVVYDQTKSEQDTSIEAARTRWKLCKPLVEAKMWAVEPLPTTILLLATNWQTNYKWAVYALPLACFLATQCDPIKLVAPFMPWRIKGVMIITKLLAFTGELTSSGELAKRCTHEGIVGALAMADQVTMCQALLHIVVHQGSIGAAEDWDVLKEAKMMLKDLESLPGRVDESKMVQAWARDPEDPQAKAFFESEVLKPVNTLASFAPEILEDVLVQGQGSVVRR